VTDRQTDSSSVNEDNRSWFQTISNTKLQVKTTTTKPAGKFLKIKYKNYKKNNKITSRTAMSVPFHT